ncbi:MAG: cell wall hydrolase [Bacilli bacterium]
MSNIIKYTSKDLDLLARLMRAEAIGEGELGMLMVGNVGVNRVLTTCLAFKNIRTINEMVYQNPGGFSGINSPLFTSQPNAKERELAQRVLSGEYYYPATNALWFYSPGKESTCVGIWYDQRLSGKWKNHCFYQPFPGVCKQLH